MKNLKYINESNKSDIIDYIKFCFLDILDDDRFECETKCGHLLKKKTRLE